VSLIRGFRTELGKACPDTDSEVAVARGSASSSRDCETLSTDAGCAGGPAGSSDVAPVMDVEQSGRTILAVHAAHRMCLGGAG
jgi:hypothetical protein